MNNKMTNNLFHVHILLLSCSAQYKYNWNDIVVCFGRVCFILNRWYTLMLPVIVVHKRRRHEGFTVYSGFTPIWAYPKWSWMLKSIINSNLTRMKLLKAQMIRYIWKTKPRKTSNSGFIILLFYVLKLQSLSLSLSQYERTSKNTRSIEGGL